MYLAVCGELDTSEAGAFYSHLAGCGECQSVLSEHAKLDGMLKDQLPKLFLRKASDGLEC
jgi:anti-sigma factor RsiW